MNEEIQTGTQQQNTMLSQLKRLNEYNALQVRLNTDDILRRIEIYLRGVVVNIKVDAEGIPQQETTKVGEPKLNELGIQSIMSRISTMINPATVQGNFADDGKGFSEDYEIYIEEAKISLHHELFVNTYRYMVETEDIKPIIDTIMGMVVPFMSRLIGNKERDSYGESLRTIESMTQKNNEGGLTLFKRGQR